jgi:hypothetical protein
MNKGRTGRTEGTGYQGRMGERAITQLGKKGSKEGAKKGRREQRKENGKTE